MTADETRHAFQSLLRDQENRLLTLTVAVLATQVALLQGKDPKVSALHITRQAIEKAKEAQLRGDDLQDIVG